MKNKSIQCLKKPADFRRVIRKHKVFNNVCFKLRASPNNAKILRYGLAVNKKNFAKAVVRNKIKRQLRQIIQQLSQIKPVDVIVVVKSNYTNNTYAVNKRFFNEVYESIIF